MGTKRRFGHAFRDTPRKRGSEKVGKRVEEKGGGSVMPVHGEIN